MKGAGVGLLVASRELAPWKVALVPAPVMQCNLQGSCALRARGGKRRLAASRELAGMSPLHAS